MLNLKSVLAPSFYSSIHILYIYIKKEIECSMDSEMVHEIVRDTPRKSKSMN